MIHELIYTSARRGLKPGTSGFCTVAQTRGMLPAMVRVAESLSAYRRRTAERAAGNRGNPVAYSHHHCLVNGESFSILSRVGVSGRDHTNRDNKLAHHIIVSTNRRCAAGPAWVAQQDGMFHTEWTGQPRYLDARPALPDGDNCPGFARHWETLAGDAGWAGVLAATFVTRPDHVVYVIFEPGMDLLPLLSESLALLPVELRWNVTFSTYFSAAPAGMSCAWRCCLGDQPLLKDPRKTLNSTILDLRKPLGQAPDNVYVQAARGEQVLPAARDGGPAGASRPRNKAARPQPGFVRMPNRHRQRLHLRPDDQTAGEDST